MEVSQAKEGLNVKSCLDSFRNQFSW